jgi:hypothetical protein
MTHVYEPRGNAKRAVRGIYYACTADCSKRVVFGITFTLIVTIIIPVFVPGRSRAVQNHFFSFCTVLIPKLK